MRTHSSDHRRVRASHSGHLSRAAASAELILRDQLVLVHEPPTKTRDPAQAPGAPARRPPPHPHHRLRVPSFDPAPGPVGTATPLDSTPVPPTAPPVRPSPRSRRRDPARPRRGLHCSDRTSSINPFTPKNYQLRGTPPESHWQSRPPSHDISIFSRSHQHAAKTPKRGTA